MGKPIPLQIDHINGMNDDNSIANIRLVCANCHAQTDTFCGKNIGRNPVGNTRAKRAIRSNEQFLKRLDSLGGPSA